MGAKQDLFKIFELLQIPKNQWTYEFDKIIKKAGRIGERWTVERYVFSGIYKIYRRNQKLGGYDYYLIKNDPRFPGPNRMHIETKINTSRLTKHQKEVRLDIIIKGGTYVIERYYLPLSLADWLDY